MLTPFFFFHLCSALGFFSLFHPLRHLDIFSNVAVFRPVFLYFLSSDVNGWIYFLKSFNVSFFFSKDIRIGQNLRNFYPRKIQPRRKNTKRRDTVSRNPNRLDTEAHLRRRRCPVTGNRHYWASFSPSFVPASWEEDTGEEERQACVDARLTCRRIERVGEMVATGWDGKLIKLSLICPSPGQGYTRYLPSLLSSFRPYLSVPIVFTSRPHLSLSSTVVPKSVRGIRSSWNEALNISIWHHSRLRESVDVTWSFASARTHTRAFLPGYALSSLFSRLSYPTFCPILSIRQKRRGSKARTRAQRERKSGDGKREK